MDPLHIISKYYSPGSLASDVLTLHSMSVTAMAVQKAEQLNLPEAEVQFIREAAMLHDIGICLTSAPEIGCFGDLPYICHGFLGHDLLVKEGFPTHALVCERHTGTGLTVKEISQFNGLLPYREMVPVSLAEKLIAYCDKFFSKDPMHLDEEKPFDQVLAGLLIYGKEKGEIFKEWHQQFNP